MADQEEWRLSVKPDLSASRPVLEAIVGRMRSRDARVAVEAAVPDEIVITHDGKTLFAYAGDFEALAKARRAIETVLQREGMDVTMFVERWDQRLDDWFRIDGRPSDGDRADARTVQGSDETIETRTMVAFAGKPVHAEFENTMREWAEKLGLRCEIVEHPHLLTTQVVFRVEGSRRKIEEFTGGLKAAEQTTWRYGHALRGVSFR